MILSQPLDCCLGLDIAKAKLDACLLCGPRAHHAQFDNSKAGLAALRAWCKKLGAPAPHTVLEATGRYGELAATVLHAAGHRVHIAHPRRIKDYARSLGRRNKTDRIDAALIASFGATRALPAWQPASNAQQLLRALLRRTAELATMLQAERNRAEGSTDPRLAKSLARIVRALEKETASLQAQITAHIQATPELREDIAHLCQIEGIGQRTAAWLAAEVPRHLPNGRAAAAWLAVTPRVRHSGTSLRSTPPSAVRATVTSAASSSWPLSPLAAATQDSKPSPIVSPPPANPKWPSSSPSSTNSSKSPSSSSKTTPPMTPIITLFSNPKIKMVSNFWSSLRD